MKQSMTTIIAGKGYRARAGYDAADGIFTGRIIGIRDQVGFQADSLEGLRSAFHEAAGDYIESCARIGKVPEGGSAKS